MNLQNLNGWQRAWVVLSIIWLFPSLWMTFQNFPTESQVRLRADQFFKEAMDNRRQKDEETNQNCRTRSGDDDAAYLSCLIMNNGTFRLSPAERRAVIEGKNAQFWKDTQASFDSTLAIDLELLPKQQIQATLNGLLIWVLPLLAIYTFGYGVAWIRSGFKT